MKYDIAIVGCGLSGAVAARYFAELGKKVCILERRNHIGGNMYDYVDEYGILVHKYGPHTFHTTKKHLYDYMCRFSEWKEYRLECGAVIDGICTPTPFNYKTIDDFFTNEKAEEIKRGAETVFSGRKTATVLEVLSCENESVRGYGEFLFQKDYSLYTAKQWGVSPDKIDSSVLKRVPLRFSYDEGYFDDEFQVMPVESYAVFFERLLSHKNITVQLGAEASDYLHIDEKNGRACFDGNDSCIVVYTGALDMLFGCSDGNLPYRSLRFEWIHEEKQSFQKYPVVAYPQALGYTRIVEFNKLPYQASNGTTYEIEYPLQYNPAEKTEPYYPVLTDESTVLYEKYRERAAHICNLYCCGRLADFRYYNMDQALERALELCDQIKAENFQ